MSKYLGGIILILSILCIGLGIWVYIEHGNRVKAEQEVETLTVSNQNLQSYLQQKNKAYEDLNKKYSKMTSTKPTDICGDTVVSEEIINWLKEGNK